MNKVYNYNSLNDVHQTVDTTSSEKSVWKRVLSFFGPAYLVSVGYMDPGNWATDLAGGSQFGYKLLWVLLMSNLMALVLQNLSARLGIVRGRDLAQANREAYPFSINICLYILAELAIAACDLAEVLGMAIGIQLLTGIPLIWAVLITILDTFLLLILQRLGIRKMEAFIIALIGIIGVSFLVEILLAKPDMKEVVKGLVPSIPNKTALYIAIGIIGATVMPHNLYLHSALVQTRKIKRTESGIKRALKLNFLDSTIALNLAFFVNAAILILAYKVFFLTGRTGVAEIKEAHQLLNLLLGSKTAPYLFAIALIAAGQSSTITGTLAGQIVMEGYLQLRINPWMRRLLTRLIAIIPAALVILINGESNINNLIVLSQVILSVQLAFAIIPLIHFVSDKKTMGIYVVKPIIKMIAWIIAIVLIFLNIDMVVEQASTFFSGDHSLIIKLLIIISFVLFTALLLITFLFPFFRKTANKLPFLVHKTIGEKQEIQLLSYKTIAVALDFSKKDTILIANAIKQADKSTLIILIHIVESASAKILGQQADDLESRIDKEKLDEYVYFLKTKGYNAEPRIGFRNRNKEIPRLVKEANAELLIIGSHGHAGVKDWLYGETINTVRHQLKIPVLIIT
ncbi:MAG TPA: Nramp family divalent metal transporter [Flavisolibacter sp.]|nr:Nramp family divalent metal transporter [Flavisolibacter sp.]